VERSISRSELYVSDEVFFTGTAVEIAPIVAVDHRPVGTGEVGPVATKLRSLYVEATRGRLLNYRQWLWPVYRTTAADKAA
jgi:branched-chain amino acid aminotransferase